MIFDILPKALQSLRANGISFSEVDEHIYRIGDAHASKLALSTGIHGNEWYNSRAVLEMCVENPSFFARKDIILSLGNPRALEQNVRFTEQDLNRVFLASGNSYEHQRARQLLRAVGGTPYLLDLHLTQEPTMYPFGIFPVNEKSLNFFGSLAFGTEGLDRIISCDAVSPNGASFDEAVARTNGSSTAITVEAGSIVDNYELVKHRIQTYVAHAYNQIENPRDHILRCIAIYKEVQTVPAVTVLHGPTRLVPGLVNLAPVRAGELLAHAGKKEIRAKHEGVILFPKYKPTTDKAIVRIASQV